MVEVIGSRDPAIQFNTTKFYFWNFFKDMLAEIKGFKYQILLKTTFIKEIENGKTMYLLPICFMSNTQTLINDLDINGSLNTSYQIVL